MENEDNKKPYKVCKNMFLHQNIKTQKQNSVKSGCETCALFKSFV